MQDKLNETETAGHETQVPIRLVRSEVARILAEAGGLADIEQDMMSLSPPQTTGEYIDRQLAAAKHNGTVEALNLAGSLIDAWLNSREQTST